MSIINARRHQQDVCAPQDHACDKTKELCPELDRVTGVNYIARLAFVAAGSTCVYCYFIGIHIYLFIVDTDRVVYAEA